MRKILLITLAIITLLTATSCGTTNDVDNDVDSSSKQISETETTEKIEDIDGYSYGYFDKYNSYAEDNGLEDTPIYIKGTVKSVFEYANVCNLSVESEDGGRWLITFLTTNYVDKANELFDEKKITCFGKYQGYSDVFLMPAIFIDEIRMGDEIYTDKDIIEETTTEPPTEPTTAEPTTEKPKENNNKVIFNNLGVKITYTGIETDWYGTNVKLLIENNSGYDYTFQVRDVSVNGYMMDPSFSCEVKNGKKANDSLDFYEGDLTDNGITDIEKIELSIHAFNWDDDSHDFDSEMITIKI